MYGASGIYKAQVDLSVSYETIPGSLHCPEINDEIIKQI